MLTGRRYQVAFQNLGMDGHAVALKRKFHRALAAGQRSGEVCSLDN